MGSAYNVASAICAIHQTSAVVVQGQKLDPQVPRGLTEEHEPA